MVYAIYIAYSVCFNFDVQHVEELLFTTEDEQIAKDYVRKYNNPQKIDGIVVEAGKVFYKEYEPVTRVPANPYFLCGSEEYKFPAQLLPITERRQVEALQRRRERIAAEQYARKLERSEKLGGDEDELQAVVDGLDGITLTLA